MDSITLKDPSNLDNSMTAHTIESFVYDPHIKPNVLQPALQLRSEHFHARAVSIKICECKGSKKMCSLKPAIKNIPVKPRCSNTLLGSLAKA